MRSSQNSESRAPVGRRDQFVPGHAAFIHGGHLFARFRIDEADRMVALIGNHQESRGWRRAGWRHRGHNDNRKCEGNQ